MSNAASVFCCCKHCQQPADLKCTACSVVRYCCKDHQTRDWQAHKQLCKWLREELLKRPLTEKTPEAKLRRKQQLAVAYWERLAVEGDAEAQFNIAVCYLRGEGVHHIDNKEAAKYLQLSAEQGHAVAQNDLGCCFELGEGIAKDEKKAVEYWQLSAAQGHDDAKQALARLGVAGTCL